MKYKHSRKYLLGFIERKQLSGGGMYDEDVEVLVNLLLEKAEPTITKPKTCIQHVKDIDTLNMSKPKTGKDRLKELKNKFEPLALADSESKGCTISLAELLGNVNTEIIWDFITTNFKPKESQ